MQLNDKPIITSSNLEYPLTPASNSIKATGSDLSELGSGDTVPSSIAEETINLSAGTLTNKARSSTQEHMVTDEKSPRNDSLENDSKAESAFFESSAHDPEPAGEALYNQNHTTFERRSLNQRRHTSPNDVPAELYSKIESIEKHERPHLLQFHSARKLPSLLRSATKEKALIITEQQNASAPDLEVARMKTSMNKKSHQRKREFLEEDTVLLGNKISEGHQNFVMAYNMLTGIRVAVSRCAGVMKKLTDADFRATTKLSFDMDGTELTPSSKYDFKFKDYCPEVFRELRILFGIDPADYLMSITGKYILSELGSPGKSGSFFYYSRDFRFIIKTIHHSEHRQLRRILKDYHAHVKNNPNTLVSQFYGLHRVKVHGGMKKVHFIVMNNLFPPHRDIHLKYDLKGSTWGRHTSIPNESQKDRSLSEFTLKDLNWLERHDSIKFGPEKKRIFLEQLKSDVALLKKINVMDYSLLLGIHDVKKGNSSQVAKLSIFDPKSSLKAEIFKTNPRDIDRGVDLPSDVFPGRSKFIFYGHNGGIRATNERNKPIPEIYYLGIIDCLTNYSVKKRLETLWRSLSHSRSTISALPAHEYGDRFVKFIENGVNNEKLKLS